MKRNILTSSVLLLFIFANLLMAEDYDNQTLLTVGKEKISFGTIRQAYEKNSSSAANAPKFSELSIDSAENFLDVYAKYKMKVMWGKAHGYTQDTSVTNEIERNKKVLAESFLIENEVINKNVERYKKMRQVDKKIAVVVIPFAPDGDTLEAYHKVTSALKELERGENFAFIAAKYSADSATARRGGIMLNWITGLRIQKSIEEPVFNLNVGEYTRTPIRTSYGYFIIKLVDQAMRKFVAVSHILVPMLNTNPAIGPVINDSTEAKKLADSIYTLLQRGKKFSDVARDLSADKVSAPNGGELGEYSRSTGIIGAGTQFVTPVDSILYTLNAGEYSKPIRTDIGYQIVKCDSVVKKDESFEMDEIRTDYKRLYYQSDRQQYIDRMLSEKFGFKVYDGGMDALISVLDTNKTVFSSKMSEKITPELAKNDLYAFNGKNYSIQNFVDSLSNNPEYNLTATTPDGLTAALKKILTSTVVTELTKDISSKYPLFNQLISEFEDGIILFKAEAANVWDKLSYDSLRAKKFYDTTKIDLTEPIRFDISEIYVLSQDKAREISEDIKNNKFSFDSAAFLFTQRQGYRDKQGHHGLVAITHKFGELAVKNNLKPGNVFGPFKQEEGYSIIKLNAVEPARKKTLQEALPIISAQVQSEYQKELESVWLKELRSTYKVEINNKLLKKAFKK